jgi:hypothetical protein
MIIYNRDIEIVERARNRLVTACIYMQTPEFVETFPQSSFSSVAPVKAEEGSFVITSAQIMSPDRYIVQADDKCAPAVEKDLLLMKDIREKVKQRTHVLSASANLASEEQDFLFDSADLIDEATGIPAGFTVMFHDAVKIEDQLTAIPFFGLRHKLEIVQSRLEGHGGRLQAVEVAHRSSMTAFEYNKVATHKFSEGYRPSAGETMLRKADRLLGDIGIPRIIH